MGTLCGYVTKSARSVCRPLRPRLQLEPSPQLFMYLLIYPLPTPTPTTPTFSPSSSLSLGRKRGRGAGGILTRILTAREEAWPLARLPGTAPSANRAPSRREPLARCYARQSALGVLEIRKCLLTASINPLFPCALLRTAIRSSQAVLERGLSQAGLMPGVGYAGLAIGLSQASSPAHLRAWEQAAGDRPAGLEMGLS